MNSARSGEGASRTSSNAERLRALFEQAPRRVPALVDHHAVEGLSQIYNSATTQIARLAIVTAIDKKKEPAMKTAKGHDAAQRLERKALS